jgi:2-polyprenyl-3-methyl-5-hydroxy-6-metoxy-1,4-benzoquinol methylase
MEELDHIFAQYSEEEGFENVLLKYKTSEVLRFVRGPSVLDIGCGIGFLARILAGEVDRVVALDGSPAKIERAGQTNSASNVTYVCSMIEEWVPPEAFDTVVATNVLEHVTDTVAFLRSCRGMLRPRGRIIVTVPNAIALHKRIGRTMGLIDDYYALTEADIAKGHLHVYDRQLLEQEIVAAGFALVHSGGILLKPLSHRQMEAWDAKVVDALYEVGKELPDYCSSLIVVGENIE